MLIRNSNGFSSGHERKTDNYNGFYSGARGYSIYNYKPTKVTIFKIIGYMMGIGGSGWFLYLRVGGWKADFLWLSMAAFWVVQLCRALVKLYFEYKNSQIELKEKKARYNKDVFS